MAPPYLARDAPVTDVFHPIEVDPGPACGIKLNFLVLDHVDGRLRQRFHLHEPLQRKPRLHDSVAAVTMPDAVGMFLDFLDQALAFEVLEQPGAALEPVKPLIRTGVFVHGPVFVHDADWIEIMALPHHKVVGVMRGCYFNYAGAEFRINEGVGDDLQLAVEERQYNFFVFETGKPFVVGIKRHRNVAEHSLGPGSGDNNRFVRSFDRIF